MKFNVKQKIDGKYVSFGNIQPGEKGPRLGMRVTPELRQMLAAKQDGEWMNFLLFEDDREKAQSGGAGPSRDSQPDPAFPQEIPF